MNLILEVAYNDSYNKLHGDMVSKSENHKPDEVGC